MTPPLIPTTPRQRAVYDRLWTLTDHGTRPWAGKIRADGMNSSQAAVRSLRDKGAIDWTYSGWVRSYTVLVPPGRLTSKPQPLARGLSKLKDGPPVGRDWPSTSAGFPRSFSDGDISHNGTRRDDGAFSAAFRKAHPDRDYRGRRVDAERAPC